MKKALLIPLLLCALPMLAQITTGELRLTVTDPTGLGVKSAVELVSQGTEYHQSFTTDSQARPEASGKKRLQLITPYGVIYVWIN